MQNFKYAGLTQIRINGRVVSDDSPELPVLMLILEFKYAGLQAASYCLCGNRFGTYGKRKESDCKFGCSGDSSQKCGGSWRNSVYQTGLGKHSLFLLYSLTT